MLSKLNLPLKSAAKLSSNSLSYICLPRKQFCSKSEDLAENTTLNTKQDDSPFHLLQQDPTNPRYKAGLQVLSTIQKEWKFEMEQAKYFPRAETIEYFQKNGYSWIEEPTSTKIILQKTSQEYVVELKFNIAQREDVPQEEPKLKREDFALDQMLLSERQELDAMIEQQEIEEEKRNYNGSQGFGAKQLVQIHITNNKNGDKMYFMAYLADGEVALHHVRFFKSEALASQLQGLKLFGNPKLYQGVNFHVLSEGLQNGLTRFVEGLGIEAEVFYHIEYLAINREQRLYLEWLKNVYDFAKHDLLTQKPEDDF